jgi:hypothetical protein
MGSCDTGRVNYSEGKPEMAEQVEATSFPMPDLQVKRKVDRTLRCLGENRAIILQAALQQIVVDLDHEVVRERRWFWWEIDTYAPINMRDVVETANRFHLHTQST